MKIGTDKIKILNVPVEISNDTLLKGVFDNVSLKAVQEKVTGETKMVVCELENPYELNACLSKSGY